MAELVIVLAIEVRVVVGTEKVVLGAKVELETAVSMIH